MSLLQRIAVSVPNVLDVLRLAGANFFHDCFFHDCQFAAGADAASPLQHTLQYV